MFNPNLQTEGLLHKSLVSIHFEWYPTILGVPDHINHGPVLCNLAAPILRWTCNSSILGPPGIIQNNLNVRSRKHP